MSISIDLVTIQALKLIWVITQTNNKRHFLEKMKTKILINLITIKYLNDIKLANLVNMTCTF